MLHANSCREYTAWVINNAQAALRTRDQEGRFGAWWGAPKISSPSTSFHDNRKSASHPHPVLPEDAIDYRNIYPDPYDGVYLEDDLKEHSKRYVFDKNDGDEDETTKRSSGDLNDRGRGRTIETQGSGLAVVRAMWEFLRRAEGAEGYQV